MSDRDSLETPHPYAFPDISDYELTTGYKTNGACREGWRMARTTARDIGLETGEQQPTNDTPMPEVTADSVPDTGAPAGAPPPVPAGSAPPTATRSPSNQTAPGRMGT